jgi:predicted nucleic acid-binding protein
MTGATKAFFDTNILIYAFSTGDRRRERALEVVMAGGMVGIQTLNEFVRVYTVKLKKPWPEVTTWLGAILQLCPEPIPLTIDVHQRGLQIAQTYGYHIYDSLMLAAALKASCTIFYSEDMHDGHEIAGMTIRNPFKP